MLRKVIESPRHELPPSINEKSGQILDVAMEVHRHIGPGMLESIYEICLCEELKIREIAFNRQVKIPLH